MSAGRLVRDAAPMVVTLDATGSALALAMYGKYNLRFGSWQVTGGLRGELVRTEWQDDADPTMDRSASYGVLIPGVGVTWQLIPELGFPPRARGFVPVAPGEEEARIPRAASTTRSGRARRGARRGRGDRLLQRLRQPQGHLLVLDGLRLRAGRPRVQRRRGAHPRRRGPRRRAAAARRSALPRRDELHLQPRDLPHRVPLRQPRVGQRRDGAELPYLPPTAHVTAGVQGIVGDLGVHAHASAMRDVAARWVPAASSPSGARRDLRHVASARGARPTRRWTTSSTTRRSCRAARSARGRGCRGCSSSAGKKSGSDLARPGRATFGTSHAPDPAFSPVRPRVGARVLLRGPRVRGR